MGNDYYRNASYSHKKIPKEKITNYVNKIKKFESYLV